MSFDTDMEKLVPGRHFYEQYSLWKLMEGGSAPEAAPPVRQAMVLSTWPHPSTLEYVVQLTAGIPMSQAKDRLLYTLGDDSAGGTLSSKLLERSDVLRPLKQAVGGDARGVLECFMSTEHERGVADVLGIPLRANDPRLQYWGTKPGGRQIFSEAGVPHPPGIDAVRTPRELAERLGGLLLEHPESRRVVVKLSEGLAGEGNGILDIEALGRRPAASRAAWTARLEELLPHTRLQNEDLTWAAFTSKMGEQGAIAELFVDGEEKTSPSGQGFIDEGGRVEVLTTHEQILGGDDGQLYLGARLGANDAYRSRVQEYTRRVGDVLASKGARGRFAVDFIATSAGKSSDWDLQAIEINLREGSTTHPYETLRVLTGGKMDAGSGLFLTPEGRAKTYISSDVFEVTGIPALHPSDAADIALRHGLQYDPVTQTGVIFHILDMLNEFEKIGVTCVADSPEAAELTYEQLTKAFEIEVGNQPVRAAESAELPPPQAVTRDLPSAFLTGSHQ
ncbi:MAG TPA: peptide ligase PGM1-related protein, partial [Myxococcaceae bacterium]|nr:peptide ligase PGM1-related protein [Myxococcaceae bacterium]